MIVDPHEFVRRGLATVIDAEPDLKCCGAVDGRWPLREVLAQTKPAVVLVDVSPRRGRGLEIIREIRAFDAGIRILALAIYRPPADVAAILRAGAEACLRKLDLASRLLRAIRRGPSVRARAAAVRPPLAPSRRATTSGWSRQFDETEREIMKLVGRGVPARAIAVRLGISVSTVEARRRRIREKLKVITATQFVEFCVRWVQQSGGSKAGASAKRSRAETSDAASGR